MGVGRGTLIKPCKHTVDEWEWGGVVAVVSDCDWTFTKGITKGIGTVPSRSRSQWLCFRACMCVNRGLVLCETIEIDTRSLLSLSDALILTLVTLILHSLLSSCMFFNTGGQAPWHTHTHRMKRTYEDRDLQKT